MPHQLLARVDDLSDRRHRAGLHHARRRAGDADLIEIRLRPCQALAEHGDLPFRLAQLLRMIGPGIADRGGGLALEDGEAGRELRGLPFFLRKHRGLHGQRLLRVDQAGARPGALLEAKTRSSSANSAGPVRKERIVSNSRMRATVCPAGRVSK